MPHKVLSSFVIACTVIALAGCTTSPSTEEETSEECTPAASGAISDGVEVEGDLGAAPTVTIDEPLDVPDETERTVIIEGEGEPADAGDSVTVQLSAYSGASGELLQASTYEEESAERLILDESQMFPGLFTALECSTAGERLVVVVPPAEGFGETGSEALGVTGEEALVLVLDVTEVAEAVEPLPRADGEDQPLPEGFPAIDVALDDSGVPTVTLPDGEPPAELELAVIKKGDGDEVLDGADVTVHYQGIVWSTKTVFNDSWAGGEPVTFGVTNTIPGFQQALVGQTVGSQVLVVIPPDLGYGPQGGQPDAGISATDTLVFIIDILATQ